jgi:hypothetical protein
MKKITILALLLITQIINAQTFKESPQHKADIDKCLKLTEKYSSDLTDLKLQLLNLARTEYDRKDYRRAALFFELSLTERSKELNSGAVYLFGAKCYAGLVREDYSGDSDLRLRAYQCLNKAIYLKAEGTDEVSKLVKDAMRGK